jgi:hypothetical protein
VIEAPGAAVGVPKTAGLSGINSDFAPFASREAGPAAETVFRAPFPRDKMKGTIAASGRRAGVLLHQRVILNSSGMSPRVSQLLVFAILTVVAVVSRPAAAQQTLDGSQQTSPADQPLVATEQSTPPGNPSAADSKKKPAVKSAAPTPVAGLVAPDGKRVVLPANVTLQDFLTWLKQRNDWNFAVNSIALDGTADDKRARLTATIIVQVRREREWVRIPIYLNEGQFTATKHRYLGATLDPPSKPGTKGRRNSNPETDAAAAYSDVTQEAGYRWWFRGKGYHRLTISMVVPVSKSVAQRRLRLKLPPLAAASTLTLRVADPNLVVVSPGDADVTRIGKTASRIRVAGLGGELDLQWRTVANPRGRAPMLQAQTSVVVDFIDDTVELTAVQRVQVLNGSVNRVNVRLPAGYQAEATGKFVKTYKIDARNRATVEFKEARSEWTEINWKLRRRFPATGGIPTLDGFQVDRAKVQTGDLAIVKVQGMRVEKSAENSLAVRRIRSADFSSPGLIRDKTLASVYRFATQPFRLNLRVARVQPQLTVDPVVRLNVSKGKMVLNAVFKVEVSDEGGTVRDLEIRWPSWNADGWTIQPLSADSPIEKRTLNAKNDDAPIRLRMKGRRGGTFEIPLSAERTIAQSKRGVSFRLPVLTAAAAQPTTARATTLNVVREPDLTLDLIDRDEQPLPEVDANETAPLARRYRITDAAAARLTAHFKSHSQSLRATAAVNLDPRPFGIYARQRISLNVEYVPLGVVQFEVPEKAAGRVAFYDANRHLLPTQPVTSKTGKPLVEVRLERPRLGKIEFVAVVMLELPKALAPGKSTSLAVPLVGVEGVKFSRVRVQAPVHSKVELALPGENWQRIPTYDGSPAWSNDTAVTSLNVRVTSPNVPHTRPFSISRALIRVSVDSAGTARYRAQYLVQGTPDAAVVVLPVRARLDSVFWDRQRISVLQRNDGRLGDWPVRMPVPSDKKRSDGGRRLLTIDYHTAGELPSRWMPAHHLVAPQFPDNVWIEETAWQVILPRDQHLSSYGAAYTPEFFWGRTSVVWSRQPTAEFADPENWIQATGGPQWSAARDGNSYVFRRYGPSEDLTVQSMSSPLIVLAGAGLAWLIGILLVKLPRLRTLAVLLTAALGAAVSGLWFATELQLLLQPALLGTALALGIVGIDRMARRRRMPAVMAIAHPSDFVINSRSDASLKPRSSPMPGSEDPTSVRAPAPVLAPPVGVGGTPDVEPSSTASEARRQG